MTLLFRLSNLMVLPFWALMILLPRWRSTGRIMRSPFVSAAPALLYAALVLPRLDAIWPAIARPTLPGIAALLGSPEGATIAWVHFLAFDLFIGRWIFLDSQERRLSPLLTAPVLFLTLMLGPLGLLIYLAIRSVASSREAGKSRTETSSARVNTTESSINGTQLGLRTGDPGKTLLERAWRTNWPLTMLGMAMILVFLAALAGVFIDHRVITSAPAWLKPAKFAVSVSVYCFTFVWLLGFVESRPRLARFAANLTVVSFTVEMAVILTQAARGTTSHFNVTTPLNTFLWLAMGAFIVVVWTMNLLLTILLLFEWIPNRPFAWSLRLGLLVSLVGMGSGFLMVRPTHEQLVTMAANDGPRIVGAHSVGVADGGPGLPVVGWSTVGGDLRVAHFLGIHAMQILPFIGWFVARRRNAFARFKEVHRLALISTIGFTYLGLVLLLVWQALRGQSVIQPDVQTLTVGLVLLALAGLSTWVIAAHAKRTDSNPNGFGSKTVSSNPKHALEIRA
jgi:ABA DEFICIENT 4-like